MSSGFAFINWILNLPIHLNTIVPDSKYHCHLTTFTPRIILPIKPCIEAEYCCTSHSLPAVENLARGTPHPLLRTQSRVPMTVCTQSVALYACFMSQRLTWRFSDRCIAQASHAAFHPPNVPSPSHFVS